MSIQSFVEPLVSQIADGTTIASSTTETILVDDFVIPAGYFIQGRKMRGLIRGKCSNRVTGPDTLTYRIRLGTTTLSSTLVVASAALNLDTTARTDYTWELNFLLTCRSAGTAGSMLVTGKIEQSNVLASTAANLLPAFLPATAPTAGTFNTKVANLLSVSAQFSASNASNAITAQEYLLESVL